MTHKNSGGRKRDDFKTLNCTSSAVHKEPTHLEFCRESYDQISEQRSDLPRIRELAFSGSIVAVGLQFLHLFKLLNVVG